MGKHAGKQVAHAFGLLGMLAHRFCKHLVDGLVEPDHLLQRQRVGLWILLPPAQYAGAQRAVFRHQIIDVEPVREAVVGMLVGGFIEARFRRRAVAPRFGVLLCRRLPLAHIGSNPPEKVARRVAQLLIGETGAAAIELARVFRPVVDEAREVCLDEVG